MFKKNKLVILSSDTPHHRYFINRILGKGFEIDSVFFETKHFIPDFKIGPLFEEKEVKFEKENLFKEVPYELSLKNLYLVESINNKEVIDRLKAIMPAIGIVFGTGLIKENIIKIFKGKLLNIHRGIPQKYRGLDSDLWAIHHNDFSNIGTTIHRVDPALDTGDIVYQKNLELVQEMKIHQIRYYTSVIASDLSLLALKDFYKSKLIFKKQETMGRYYSFMPYDLKVQVSKKFNNFCEKINE